MQRRLDAALGNAAVPRNLFDRAKIPVSLQEDPPVDGPPRGQEAVQHRGKRHTVDDAVGIVRGRDAFAQFIKGEGIFPAAALDGGSYTVSSIYSSPRFFACSARQRLMLMVRTRQPSQARKYCGRWGGIVSQVRR